MRDILASRPGPAGPTSDQRPAPGRLVIGRNIALRGEIAACDSLVVEGFVSASTADCRAITVAPTGAFEGEAVISTAEIAGDFDGRLTVRDRLTVRGTGRVAGRVRYGRLEVEPGGQVSGDICAIDAENGNAKSAK